MIDLHFSKALKSENFVVQGIKLKDRSRLNRDSNVFKTMANLMKTSENFLFQKIVILSTKLR